MITKKILTSKALSQLNTKDIRAELQLVFNVIERTVIRYVSLNEPNGPLTTKAALNVIEKHTGLSEEEILTDAFVNDTAKV